MFKKGELRYEQQTLNVVRTIGLITPLFLLGYGLFILSGVITSDSFRGDAAFWMIMVPWLLLGILQFIWPPRHKLHMATNLAIYHILAGLYILFVSGFTVPFLSTWALLYLVSYIYFSYVGVLFSIVCFFFIMLTDATMVESHVGSVLYSTMACLSTLLVGLAAISLNRIKEYNQEAVERSKRSEILQRDRLLTLVNNLAEPIISTDRNGHIKVYNAAVLGLLDTNASLDDKTIDSVLHLKDHEGKQVKILERLRAAQSVTIDDSLTAEVSDDQLRIELTYSPIRSSYNTTADQDIDDGYVIIIRDVTKTKSLEEERDEFISVVSHELRTPIAITEGAIDNARVIYAKGGDSKQVSNNLSQAHEQVLFLSKMVNDLSTLSRAERNVADQPELIDVTDLAHALHAEYTPEADKRGLHFNLSLHEPLGSVMASRLYLHELQQNFITNAIKYTKEGSITLTIAKQGDNICFTVSDTGIGISKSDQGKIFQKFYRSEDYRTRETGGTGLGLYVAKKLSKKLGCEIEVKSRLNHGSTFSFTLPQYKPKH
jgi:signal transduction histidine kinase